MPVPSSPAVTVGLPVHNGENYLAETLASILAQDFSDFELVISDNASTDRTAEIIADFAARDARIRVLTQPVNIGAARNYNAVYHAARGRYFKWVAHDDPVETSFLSEAVAFLDRTPDCVGVTADKTTFLDARGTETASAANDMDPKGASRVGRALHFSRNRNWQCGPFFGLFRRDAMADTNLHGDCYGSDWIFLLEMLLRGRIGQVATTKTYFREHGEQFSTRVAPDLDQALDWSTAGRVAAPRWPTYEFARQYVLAVRRARLGSFETATLLALAFAGLVAKTLRGG